MLERIRKILINQIDITGFKICETMVQSNELFFVKKNVDMDRAKNVHYFKVTVYIDSEENGSKFTGSSTTNIHPTMSDAQIEEAIKETAFAAKYVKNPYFPLTKPAASYETAPESSFAKENLPYWMNMITKAIYKNDIYDKGGINSCEIFLNKIETRIVNSEGIDVHSVEYKCIVEFITTWKEDGEEIELYRCINCSDFDEDLFAEEVKNMITTCREKAVAGNTPALQTFPVILTREAVRDFFSYYTSKSNASSIYNQFSTWNLGDMIQGDQVKGDLITVTLDPFLKNSTDSSGFDGDGVALFPVTIIENGELKRYEADTRYAHYLGVAPTGSIRNVVVNGGCKTAEELQQEPHLTTVAFSDFFVDELTGDFCGEIRLAWYYDGKSTIPVSGGSISGNINKLHHELYLSKELWKDNNFEGPLMVKLLNVTIAGIE